MLPEGGYGFRPVFHYFLFQDNNFKLVGVAPKKLGNFKKYPSNLNMLSEK